MIETKYVRVKKVGDVVQLLFMTDTDDCSLLVIAADSNLTVEKLHAMSREDKEIECTDEQLRFCVFIINQISQAKNKPSDIVYNLLAESGILDDYIIGCYDTLHTLGREYLIEDITGFLHDRGFAI